MTIINTAGRLTGLPRITGRLFGGRTKPPAAQLELDGAARTIAERQHRTPRHVVDVADMCALMELHSGVVILGKPGSKLAAHVLIAWVDSMSTDKAFAFLRVYGRDAGDPVAVAQAFGGTVTREADSYRWSVPLNQRVTLDQGDA